MPTLQGYYQKATAAQLPMGNMTPLIVKAEVTDSNQTPARKTDGFLVITEWFNGTFFQQSRATNRLTTALNRETISHDPLSVDCQRWGTHLLVLIVQTYWHSVFRINRGIDAARVMRYLYDCQGFIRKGNAQPIAFIDINWHATSTSGVDDMQKDFDTWVKK